MTKFYSFFTLLLTISLFSCNSNNENDREYSFIFFPKEIKTMWSDNLCLTPVVKDQNGEMTYSVNEEFRGTSCKAELYILGLYTCNLAYDTTQVKNYLPGNEFEFIGNWPVEYTHYKPLRFFQTSGISHLFTDGYNATIEQRLKDDYTKYANKVSSSSSSWAAPPVYQEYRLTEISDLTITCNQALFGRTSGSALNEYFHIYNLNPGCIFAGNNQLKVTHEAVTEKIKNGLTIDEWLSYRPLSAAYFYFKLTSLPTELPTNNLEFSISLETVDGEKITCTGKPIMLTP